MYLFTLVFTCLVLGLNKWPGFETIVSIDQELKLLSHRERVMLIPQTP